MNSMRFPASLKPQHLLVAAALAAGAFACLVLCRAAFQANGAFGFPLDDPWIHLQFARNLRAHGSYSYFASTMVTSGSTSPLYTLILAAGFFITANEMILSYVLGVGFFVAGAFVLSRIGDQLFKDRPVLMIGAVLLFLSEARLRWAALSGMETTLFVLLLLLVWHLYRIRSTRWLGVAAGLLLWTRPEAVIFFAALTVDICYDRFWVRHSSSRKRNPDDGTGDYRWLLRPLCIAATLCLGYAVFNYILSGSILPNTYTAKIKYYGGGRPGFAGAVFAFLTQGHMPVLAALASVAVIEILWSVIARARQKYLVPLLWVIGLYTAYALKLPFLYQEGRYLMPVLPFVIVLGMRGIEILVQKGTTVLPLLKHPGVGTVAAGAICGIVVVQFVIGAWQKADNYIAQCGYINDRQVRTATWIRDNLPATAVIGTHDVGAIAFYSGRRVVDMVGLVSPEMIDNIGSYDRLKSFLVRSHVTHLAVLRNWFEVVNQNAVFQTDERKPEIMEVFPLDPVRTHFTPQNASMLAAQGEYYLGAGQIQRAGPLLQESLRIDPEAARTHSSLGLALLSIGKDADAEREIATALTLQPDLWQAKLALAQLNLMRNNAGEALHILKDVQQRNPGYAPVYQALSRYFLLVKKDSSAAQEYLERYKELSRDHQ
jgi:tetratricopeptide (TPR) repeat protein